MIVDEMRVKDESSDRVEQLRIVQELGHCSVQWKVGTPDSGPLPEAVLELFADEMQGRIYDNRHEDPLVSVHFDATGRAVRIVVRRASDFVLEVDDISAAPDEEVSQ